MPTAPTQTSRKWVQCRGRREPRVLQCRFVGIPRRHEPEDEEAAFSYAEERVRATASPLAVTNRSCETVDALFTAMRTHDVDGGLTCFSDGLCTTIGVSRNEREAVGQDGEQHQWTRIYVSEVRDGRVASVCQFDLEEEAAAFAYAEERIGSVKA
jgi:hypothetical protein